MTLPADISETISRELSNFIEAVIENYESQGHGPPTLRSVREAMSGGLLDRLADEGRIHREDQPSLLSEVSALIDAWGDDMEAARFTRPRASEDLSTVIEALLDERDEGPPPTLAGVRDAMQAGLLARLIGHGQLDDDDEQTLLEEIEEMIERYGADALAEDYLGYY